MGSKETLLFVFAVIAALYGYIHYGKEIPKKTLKPRPFSWLIWGVLSTCVAIIQLRHGAGLGAVGALLGAASGYVLAGMAWFYGHRHVHGADAISLLLTIGLLLAWNLLGDTATAVIATLIYLIGFIPTVVRAWKAPYNERFTPFVTAVIKYTVSFVLLGEVSIETAVYPAGLAFANVCFISLLYIKRKTTKQRKHRLKKRHNKKIR